jgi:hypothetical protein
LQEGKELDKSLESMFDHIAEDPIGRMGLGFELISLASRNPSIRKILSEAYEKNLKMISEFLKKNSAKSSAQNTLQVTFQAINLVALQFGLMANLILGIDEKDARKAWEQSTKAIVKP